MILGGTKRRSSSGGQHTVVNAFYGIRRLHLAELRDFPLVVQRFNSIPYLVSVVNSPFDFFEMLCTTEFIPSNFSGTLLAAST